MNGKKQKQLSKKIVALFIHQFTFGKFQFIFFIKDLYTEALEAKTYSTSFNN
jgi:hypothetical protein